jgi:hypothetical protein
MFFSVGEAGGAVVLDVVVALGAVVVVGVAGAWLAELPHAASTAPMPISAAPPQTAIRRRPETFGLMFHLLLCCCAGMARLESAGIGDSSCGERRRRRIGLCNPQYHGCRAFDADAQALPRPLTGNLQL